MHALNATTDDDTYLSTLTGCLPKYAPFSSISITLDKGRTYMSIRLLTLFLLRLPLSAAMSLIDFVVRSFVL